MRGAKGTNEFYSFISRKRKNLENVSAAEWGRELGTKGHENSGVFNAGFASVSTDRICLEESHIPESRGSIWSNKDFSSIEENQVEGI